MWWLGFGHTVTLMVPFTSLLRDFCLEEMALPPSHGALCDPIPAAKGWDRRSSLCVKLLMASLLSHVLPWPRSVGL